MRDVSNNSLCNKLKFVNKHNMCLCVYVYIQYNIIYGVCTCMCIRLEPIMLANYKHNRWEKH